MRAIAGSILVLAASICVLATSGQVNDAPLFLTIACIPFVLGLYFLFVKDKPGA